MQEYPIGTPGKPWQAEEKAQWLAAQSLQRSYASEVLSKLADVSSHFSQKCYGSLPIDDKKYPLYAFVSKNWKNTKPAILITGGVHGYETSGVQGAIDFLTHHVQEYIIHFNFIVAPCISPWGYETINRWNSSALDPNRSFCAQSPCPEAALLMTFVKSFMQEHAKDNQLLAHIDLHETTDTDNSEFRPALSARDGTDSDQWEIPDGFYTVADTTKPQLAFQQAIIKSVEQVTHIAPADAKGKIIGSDILSPGVIAYDKAALFLCAGFTDADYVSTTEVYPDSSSASPELCIHAQVAAIKGGLDYLVKNRQLSSPST